ncbi:MAG: hypothetical protein NTX05_07215 [Fusobacteria bacterium]|nr:hypothetical protein [Fusobacteriota bacterium]
MNHLKYALIPLILLSAMTTVWAEDVTASPSQEVIQSSVVSGGSTTASPIKKPHKTKVVKPASSWNPTLSLEGNSEDDYTKFDQNRFTKISQTSVFGDSSTVTTGNDNFSMSFNQFSGSKVQLFQLNSGDEIIFYTNSKITKGVLKIGFVNLDDNSKIGDITINKKVFTTYNILNAGKYAYIVVGDNAQGNPAHITVKWKIINNTSEN